MEGCVSSGREGMIWRWRVSSRGVCIIWLGRVSSGAGEHHLEGKVSSDGVG
jgi:hypothetical protein